MDWWKRINRKQNKRNPIVFRAFVRFILCQFTPSHPPTSLEIHTPSAKLSVISQVMTRRTSSFQESQKSLALAKNSSSHHRFPDSSSSRISQRQRTPQSSDVLTGLDEPSSQRFKSTSTNKFISLEHFKISTTNLSSSTPFNPTFNTTISFNMFTKANKPK